MDNTKLNQLKSLYGEAKAQADLVPDLKRKVARLESELATASRRAITEDVAGEIADVIISEGFLKLASREDFVDRITNHPEEVADTIRKVASFSGGFAVQVGSADGLDEMSDMSNELDPLTAFALGR